ncbi:MAG TPA: hypothetical protein VFM69_01215 [Pricia sp.]|nr:hypothetical protein [Pricia sp.]
MPTIILNEKLAYPGAGGYGRYAGVSSPPRSLYVVTSLAENGVGTLKDAISQPDRDIVLNNLSGYIPFLTGTFPTANNLRIHGQTGNVAITANMSAPPNSSLLSFQGGDVVVRYLRWRRQGEEPGQAAGGGAVLGGDRYIFDHCNWTTMSDDFCGAANQGGSAVTFSNCLFYISLEKLASARGTGKGLLIYNDISSASIIESVFAHVGSRQPSGKAGTIDCNLEFVNNLIHNWGSFATHLGDPNGTVGVNGTLYTNLIGNDYVTGNNTYPSRYAVNPDDFSSTYLHDNIGRYRPDNSYPESAIASELGTVSTANTTGTGLVGTPFSMTPASLNAMDVSEVKPYVLPRAGANKYRDSHDIDIIAQVQAGSGPESGYNHDKESAWSYPLPALAAPDPINDTTGSGIDDAFEAQHGLTGDGTGTTVNWDFGTYQVVNNAGYTDREMYWSYLANDFADLPDAGGITYFPIDDQERHRRRGLTL